MPPDGPWRRGLKRDGFEFLQKEMGVPRITRFLALDALVAKESYEDQVEKLASFACRAFDKILRELSPPSVSATDEA